MDVTIFRQKRGLYTKVRLTFSENGIRQEICRSDFAQAKEEANRVLDRLTEEGGSVIELSGVDRLAYFPAQKQLQPMNVAIDVAALLAPLPK